MKTTRSKYAYPYLTSSRSRLADGSVKVYFYHQLSRVRVLGEPGSPEFDRSYELACRGHKTRKGRRQIASRRRTTPPVTNVYFIRDDATGLVKIGTTKDVRRRLAVLQTGSAAALTLLGSVVDSTGGLLEGGLHARFAQDRVRGEWFTLSDRLAAYVEEVRRAKAAGVEVVEV